MIRIYLSVCITALFFASCSTFVSEEYQPAIKTFEKKVYVLKKDISIGGLKLSKNRKIRIIINGGDEWVKVYGYGYDEDKLKSKRILILYLFDSDFKNDEFDMKVFREKLFQIISSDVNAIKSKKKKRRRKKRRRRRRKK